MFKGKYDHTAGAPTPFMAEVNDRCGRCACDWLQRARHEDHLDRCRRPDGASCPLRAEDAADIIAQGLVVTPLPPLHTMRRCGMTVQAHAPTVGSWEGGILYGEAEDAMRTRFRAIARAHLPA